MKWRDGELLDCFYPGTTSISGATLLGDDVIEKIASCGLHLESNKDLIQHVRWQLGFNAETGNPTAHGKMLLEKLRLIYGAMDQEEEEEAKKQAEGERTLQQEVPAAIFYTPVKRPRPRPLGRKVDHITARSIDEAESSGQRRSSRLQAKAPAGEEIEGGG